MIADFVPGFISFGSSVAVLGTWERSIRGFLGVTMAADDIILPFLTTYSGKLTWHGQNLHVCMLHTFYLRN